VIDANRALGVDAMILPIVPHDLEEVRTGDVLLEELCKGMEPEDLLERAERIPDTAEEILSSKFDAEKVEADYDNHWKYYISLYGDMVFMPNHWEAIANFSLYFEYGYEAFLAATALYPEAVGRIYWEDAVLARARNEILLKLYEKYDVAPVLFCGQDICLNSGPMCAPIFLRKYYWPHAKYSLEPLVDGGIRLIHHCDGNVMPNVDDMIAAGFSGFQGFQYECGVDPFLIAEKKSVLGEDLLFMSGLNVTRTLPFGTPEDVKDEVDYCIDYSGGGRNLLFFTSSSIGQEVPIENVRAGYRHIQEFSDFGRTSGYRRWPWAVKHPDR